jgi:hypothetical protein
LSGDEAGLQDELESGEEDVFGERLSGKRKRRHSFSSTNSNDVLGNLNESLGGFSGEGE